MRALQKHEFTWTMKQQIPHPEKASLFWKEAWNQGENPACWLDSVKRNDEEIA